MKQLLECVVCAIMMIALPIVVFSQQSPQAGSDASKPTTVTIQQGDTVYSIIRKNNISLDAFREANPDVKFSSKRDRNGCEIPLIRPGDIIRIPAIVVSRSRTVTPQPSEYYSVVNDVNEQKRRIGLLRLQLSHLTRQNQMLTAYNQTLSDGLTGIRFQMASLRADQTNIMSTISQLRVDWQSSQDNINFLNAELEKEIENHNHTRLMLYGVCMVVALCLFAFLIWYFSGYITKVATLGYEYMKRIASQNQATSLVENPTVGAPAEESHTFEQAKRAAEEMARRFFCFDRGFDFGDEPDYFSLSPVEYGTYTGLIRLDPTVPNRNQQVVNRDIFVFSFDVMLPTGGAHSAYVSDGDLIHIAVAGDKFAVLGILPPQWSSHFTEKSSPFLLNGNFSDVPQFDASTFRENIATTNTIN
ncbi:MAG: LysM domain [Candidatus Parcubacteria bacterium]